MMGRFAAKNPHLMQAEYEFWASRNNTEKEVQKEEDQDGTSTVVMVDSLDSVKIEDDKSGSDIDRDNL
ncbi:hypothetical protein D1007_00529 [Hordeum vulgare]|nr:hypothetical protein D1007_00529 [Hordeum vulgare]